MFILAAADCTELGRVNIDFLPDQALMELLVSEVADTRKVRDENGDFLPIDKWSKVTVDRGDKVTEISWGFFFTSTMGRIHLDFLPREVARCDVAYNKLHGKVDMTQLPRPLRALRGNGNYLRGTCDLTALPSELRGFFSVEIILQAPSTCHRYRQLCVNFRFQRMNLTVVLRCMPYPKAWRPSI